MTGLDMRCERCGGDRSPRLSVCINCAIRRPEGPEPAPKLGMWVRLRELVSNEGERS